MAGIPVTRRTASWRRLLPVVALALMAISPPALAQKKGASAAPAGPAYQDAVNAAHAKFKDLKEGKNADYIPALAEVDPNIYGIALVTTDGKVYSTGDLTSEVSIQSISKVFTMALVMQEQGPDAILNRRVDERQHSQALGATGFTVFALAMVVGRSAGTNIVERVGRVTALRTAGLLTAVGVALSLTVPADPATFVGIALWGLGVALVFPTAMSAAAERGETPAGGIAAVATLGYTGFLVGPPIIGFLAASFSLS